MSIFPDISRVLTRAQTDIRRHLGRALALVPERVHDEYLESVRAVRENPALLSSSMRWFLHNYFLFTGFLQLVVHFREKPVFSRGAEILTKERAAEQFAEDVRDNPQISVTHLQHRETSRGMLLEIDGVAPAPVAEIAATIMDNEILPLARNYYFNMSDLRDPRLVDLNRAAEEPLLAVLEREIGDGRPVSLTHFRFQEMHLYFEILGEHRTREIIREIIATIRGNLKKGDYLFQLSPLSYVVLSPGARQEQIERRFESIYFQIKTLILDYDLTVATVDALPVRMYRLWEDLRV